jgi:hypothetical protein
MNHIRMHNDTDNHTLLLMNLAGCYLAAGPSAPVYSGPVCACLAGQPGHQKPYKLPCSVALLCFQGDNKCPGVNDSGLREASQPRVSEPGRLLPLLCGALSAVRPHGVTGAEARKHRAVALTHSYQGFTPYNTTHATHLHTDASARKQ